MAGFGETREPREKSDAELIQLMHDNPQELMLITCLEVRGVKAEVRQALRRLEEHARELQRHERCLIGITPAGDDEISASLSANNSRRHQARQWAIIVGVPSAVATIIVEVSRLINSPR